MRKTKRYRACSLSWEKAQRARLRRARSAARWLESVLVRQKRPAPARRPSSSVHGRAPTCQPRPPTSSRRSRVNTCERATACSLSRKEARHARLRCARAAPRWLASFFALWKPTTAAIQFSPSVHGRAPTCQSRPPTSSRRPRVRTHHRTITPTLSGGGAPRTLAMRARGAALVGVGPAVTEASYSSETSLSFGARPCSDVPAAASNEQPALACAHTPTHLRTYSLGRRRTTRACDACARRRADWTRSWLDRSQLQQRDGPLPRCTAVLRRASRGLQQAASIRACAHANAPLRALSLGRRRGTRACGVSARRRAE